MTIDQFFVPSLGFLSWFMELLSRIRRLYLALENTVKYKIYWDLVLQDSNILLLEWTHRLTSQTLI